MIRRDGIDPRFECFDFRGTPRPDARQALSGVKQKVGDTEVSISVMTLMELAHGAARADTAQRKSTREKFIEELLTAMPVYPITTSVAVRAGILDGQNLARGIKVPLSDLLIGVSALELGYGVGTANLRHFQLIAGLSVVQL